MCGICGVFDFQGRPVELDLVRKMSDAIRHRGPDGEGYYVCQCVGLGHRRLSIIDLAGGDQPISNEDGSLQVIFNGEIYNFVELREQLEEKGHVFKTRSDTEVIVHSYEEWGLDCPTHFNGIFAFAVWDSRRKQLFLARDHVGVKPLYYTVIGSRFVFASEIKALLQHPACRREVDLSSLGQLFTLRYVPAPKTLFSDIKKLSSGHSIVVSAEGMEIARYWKWTPRIREVQDERPVVETYQDLIQDAFRLQMRSDVPVGLFLSSGVDSGTLLALMSEHSTEPVHTFTIGFEGGERSNETEDARKMARQFGADHSEMVIGPKDYENYYQRYLRDLEEPLGNESAAAFYFVSLIASRQVKVVLTGQGVDEPWAGYPRHIGIRISQLYSRLPRLLTEQVFDPLVTRFVTRELLRRGVKSLNDPDILARLVKIYSFFSSEMKGQLFQPWLLDQISADGVQAREALSRLQSDVSGLDPLTQMVYIDTRADLCDDLLMVADKTAMANSLEARVPFLDYRIVEFAESLPPSLKLHRLSGKYLHKKAVQKWLPKEIVYRKKKGFANPVDKWLRTHMKPFVQECLLSEHSAVRRYFNPRYVQQLIIENETRQNYMRHLNLLIAFELWHQQFISS
jgi:asparagine synthase (glutamine-hydrolysing)